MISLSMPPWARGGRKSLLEKKVGHKPRKDWERISKNMYVRFDGALIHKEGDDWVAKTPIEYSIGGLMSRGGGKILLQHGQKPSEVERFKSHRRARKKIDALYPLRTWR